MSPLKPINIPQADIKVCVVDFMRVSTFMKRKEAVKNLPEITPYVILDDYSPGDGNI